ncbi:MAG: IS701 family transposase [Alphaproteobacteria bacterium]|nr:MAG: IS701 family transposase [Alphaproteobacteria bacterium]
MGRQAWEESEARFVKYLDGLTSVIGHADRAAPLKGYCTGLLAAEGRRSVEPMAAVTAPAGVSAQHQKLLHFVANAAWSDELVLAKVQEMVLPQIERHGPIEAWIIDDTSFPKQGRHSVGVHHQYCGQLGKQANCQVVVTLSIANHHASLPIAYRLYLPEAWVGDAARRKKARIPEEISFQTKPEIALDQVRAACAAGVARGVVLMDASYGSNSALRGGVSALALSYVAGIVPTIKVQAVTESGKPGPRVSAKELALGLPKGAWRTVTWREGTNERLASRFARVRVRTSPIRRAKERAEETLLVEWPEGEEEPTKYWLATLPKSTSFRRLVDIAKMRWRIERDYQDLKQEIGLGHYEGRGWPGFHHHGTLCIAAYGFLVSERETIPPSGTRSSRSLTKTALPDGYRPRGAPDPAPTSRAQLDCHPASQTGRRHRSNAAQMPMLRT